MCERYECKLSPELLKKAVDELNEPANNALRLAAIDKLRKRFHEEESELELIRSDDAFLLRFLRVKKFDVNRAVKMLINYHRQRKEWRELFDLVDAPRELAHYLSIGPVMYLGHRAKDGTFVIIGRPGFGFNADDGGSMIKFIACLVLTLEKLLENEEMQIYGITVIENMQEIGLSSVVHFGKLGKRMIQLLQEGMPVRVKSVNMVNEALVFDAIYAIVKSFMKEKMKKRLTLHGSDFTQLHQKIDKNVLPPILGGLGPTLDVEAWKKGLLSTVGEGEDTAL